MGDTAIGIPEGEPAPERAAPWHLGFTNIRVLGVALLLVTFVYLAAVVLYRQPIRFRSFELSLPPWRLALLQIPVAAADLAAAAGVL